MKQYDAIGLQIPQIFLPRPDIDPGKWAVIACDQFTSQPDYWEKVNNIVGNHPSTLHLILPEVYLESGDIQSRVLSIQNNMRTYMDQGILIPLNSMVYVERFVSGMTRKGLMLALDLEKYDYKPGSRSMIRATEGTIEERLPPRMKIRKGAALEVPHILVLIDDPARTVIEPIEHQKNFPGVKTLYNFDLMLGSGHITGYALDNPDIEKNIISSLEKLADHQTFTTKYNVPGDTSVLLFAVGDGNHSLATAKAIWEETKHQVGLDHPARYALVEIENIYDEGLVFEPIHRVLFNCQGDMISLIKSLLTENGKGDHFRVQKCTNREEMISLVTDSENNNLTHRIGAISEKGFFVLEILNPEANLPVGTLQPYLDKILSLKLATKIDYVHGDDIVCDLGKQSGNMGFLLPAMDKRDLFRTVILDGVLPRKTFSMGEAHEKRFYMESRAIE